MENSKLQGQGKSTREVERQLQEKVRERYHLLRNKKAVSIRAGVTRMTVNNNINGKFPHINRKVVKAVNELYNEQLKIDQELLNN